MNPKFFVYIIVGMSVFLGIWFFSMFVALGILVGFGFGVWWHDWITNIFKNYQKGIYLSEKANMEHRRKELESELEKLNKDD
jgi:hypothetical protein